MPALPVLFEALHQVFSFLPLPVVARWAIFPAPETLNREMIEAVLRVTFCLTEVTETDGAGVGVGSGVGAAVGVTLFDAGEAAVCQELRAARAVNEYPVPGLRPVTVQEVAGGATVHPFEES